MGFLHPALLALLPLAAIPIILHLITSRKLKVTELGTYRFLFDQHQRRQNRLTFLNALLTALRTLFLLLLILTVSRPVLKHWRNLFRSAAGDETVMLLDCSASMNARTDGVSALERAKTAAVSVSQRLDPEERLTVFRITGTPQEVFSQWHPDRDQVRDKIEAAETSPVKANLFAALKHVFDRGATREGMLSVYLFTDAQATGWREAEQRGLDQVVPGDTRLVVVDVGSRAGVPNQAVVGDPPARDDAIVGLPVLLRPRVANYSPQDAEVTVKAFLSDREVARAVLALKPGEQRTAELSFVPKDPGLQQGRFEIGDDRFPDDDNFLFTLSVRPQVPVVLVNGRPSADPFQNEALYVRAALTSTADELPAAAAGAPGPALGEFQRSLDVQEMPEGSLSAAVLQKASVAILANCGQLNATHFGWLRDFVNAGGGLLVFPGDLVAPKTYNEQFFPVPGPQQENLTATQLGEATGDPTRPNTFERLAAVDFRHPVLNVFDGPQARAFATVRFFRCFPLRLAERARNGWPLMRFASGAPALVESRLGKGLVITAAFPLNSRWTNLPLKPEFVPLLLRLVNHVQRQPELSAPASVAAASAAEIAVPEDWGTATGTLTDPAGLKSALTFHRADRRLVAAGEEPRRKGYCKVEVSGGTTAQPHTATTVVAANVAPEESDFTPMTRDALRGLMPQARLTVIDASAEAQQLHGAIGDEREVWRPMIWLLFVIIGVEFALATLGPGPKNDPWTQFWERGRALLRRRDQIPKPGRRVKLGRSEPEPVPVG